MGTYQLIHLNVVRPLGAFSADVPEAQYFFQQLPIVFGDADQADGLRWHNHGIRLPDNSYLDLPQIFGLKTEWPNNPHVLTMAGWDSAKALHSFTYRLRSHADGMKRLRDWVDRSEGPTMVMFWAERTRRVTLEEGWERLGRLRRDGPSEYAFTLQQRYDAPDAGDEQAVA
ncbi:MAG: DUF3291 domain-containing protein [Pseudomonadota bacterium]